MIKWRVSDKITVLEINYFSSNIIGGTSQFLGLVTRNC
ncbi:hypothetical protein LEP1GSC058_1120 [Leptospira fainei serovar Hurstbridge str. BUT 6]|uniref:Uncharacterized protein n=1 Tax=Leptospira fainei serovar Hurstbridge str. BUT 6 TaxID=1193011 RepID=S3UW50_9LEPT|nr:hypothetical protein LEP1GSC058_1120 [Leptospira fainei serovar Hurstbridge str. BUT 6]